MMFATILSLMYLPRHLSCSRVFRETFIDTHCYDQIIRLARSGMQQTECKWRLDLVWRKMFCLLGIKLNRVSIPVDLCEANDNNNLFNVLERPLYRKIVIIPICILQCYKRFHLASLTLRLNEKIKPGSNNHYDVLFWRQFKLCHFDVKMTTFILPGKISQVRNYIKQI